MRLFLWKFFNILSHKSSVCIVNLYQFCFFVRFLSPIIFLNLLLEYFSFNVFPPCSKWLALSIKWCHLGSLKPLFYSYTAIPHLSLDSWRVSPPPLLLCLSSFFRCSTNSLLFDVPTLSLQIVVFSFKWIFK